MSSLTPASAKSSIPIQSGSTLRAHSESPINACPESATPTEIPIRAGADDTEETINLQSLSDDDLDRNLKRLAAGQRQYTAIIVAHLRELDNRSFSQRTAYPSLFVYCVKELKFSEDVACRHILAVRLARRFPSILSMLARGDINLTTISILNRHLNPGNHKVLLRWAAGKSRRELERRAAELNPPAASPSHDVIRHLPRPTSRQTAPIRDSAPSDATPLFETTLFTTPILNAPPEVSRPPMQQPLSVAQEAQLSDTPQISFTEQTTPPTTTSVTSPATTSVTAPAMTSVTAPTTTSVTAPATTSVTAPATTPVATPDTTPTTTLVASSAPVPVRPSGPSETLRHEVRIAFTAPETLLLKIERARTLLWHKFPSSRMEDVLGEIAQFYLARKDPALKKKAAAPRPPGARKRRIPQWVKDLVFQRDGGRCAFLAGGRRCEATGALEYDHVVAWAHGGASDDPANIRILCRQHNQFLGREVFGTPRRYPRRRGRYQRNA